MIGWERRADGIVILTLDDPARSANAMNAGYVRAMESTVDRLVLLALVGGPFMG